ncbi:FliA/WhiG family RNA polymerase sigma factor [Candidatus Clavichlamydia salmonicola]|uniref:FliA/WhiG family RNA polymerase sigma factor n=1 Tax=Candidatus Clavichlamydia salmonicola TaxID=469812 RepID=UPI00189106CB|nr:FliA/WhiG family RNA polymerase sigma factor [Candidatus Clavichlamydia salmonicola]
MIGRDKRTFDKKIWERYLANKAIEDRDALIEHYLYLVKCVVSKMGSTLPSHVKLNDLYSSGVRGLIRSVEKYNPERGSHFEGYSMFLIKAAIIDELRENDWIPRSVYQKANKLKQVMESLSQALGREPTDEEVCQHLKISAGDYEVLLNTVRPAVFISLNGTAYNNEDALPSAAETIADKKAKTSLEEAERKEQALFLESALKGLNKQEQEVLALYYYEEKTLKEIGKDLGVSESRICQIHTKSILKLRNSLSFVSMDRK